MHIVIATILELLRLFVFELYQHSELIMHFFNIVDAEKRTADEHSKSLDPRTKEALWQVPVAQEKDLDDAVQAAHRAFGTWKGLPIEKRQAHVLALAQVLSINRSEIHGILSKETGKSVGQLFSRRQFMPVFTGLTSFSCTLGLAHGHGD